MPFDPESFLSSIGAEYQLRGKRIALACPWCRAEGRDADGDHFFFRVEGTSWGCWRSREHGGSLLTVVRELSGWSFEAAKAYIGGAAVRLPLEELRERAARLAKPREAAVRDPIEFPEEFRKPLRRGLTARFLTYLEGRGFDDPEALVERCGLLCALRGEFANRLVLPVYSEVGLEGWTARAIGAAERRYRAFPLGDRIKDYLYNGQLAHGGRRLFVVEGPFDALKVDWFGREFLCSAVALMGTSATEAQASEIIKLSALYDEVVVLLDRGEVANSYRLRAALPGVAVRVGKLTSMKDPGAMNYDKLKALFE